jgi:hypothetical protein
MLALAPHLKIYVHLPPTDLRKSFDGLTGLVRSAFQADPRDGSWFLFVVSGSGDQDQHPGQTRPRPSKFTRRFLWYHLGCLSLVLYRAPKDAR